MNSISSNNVRVKRPAGKKYIWWSALILAVGLVVRIAFCFREFETLSNMVLFDDSFIEMEISRNIAAGNGITWNGEDRTSGFQPLWTFFSVPGFMLFSEDLISPLRFNLVFQALINIISGAFLVRLAFLVGGPAASVLCAVFWSLNPNIMHRGLNLMETSVAFLFIIWSFLEFLRLKSDRKRSPALLGCLLGLSFLARVDSFVLIVLFMIEFLIDRRDRLFGKHLFQLTAPMAVISLPWVLFIIISCGGLTPVSGAAVRFWSSAFVGHNVNWDTMYSKMLLQSWEILKRFPYPLHILNLLVIPAVWAVSRAISRTKARISASEYSERRARGSVRLPWSFLAYPFMLVAAYSFYVLGFWYLNRYYYPIIAFSLFSYACMISYISQIFRKKKALRFIFIIITAVILLNTNKNLVFQFFTLNPQEGGYYEAAKWINRNIPAGSVLACPQTGAFGYFCNDIDVVNLDGVTNRKALEALENREVVAYLQEIRADYLLIQRNNLLLLEQHDERGALRNALQFIKEIEEVETMGDRWRLYKVLGK